MLQMIQSQNQTSSPMQAGRQAFESRLDTAAQKAGLDSSQVSQLHTDIQNAVQQAMKNASGDGSNRTAVRSAVDSVLQKYGIDPSSVRPQQGAGKAHHGHHHKAGQIGNQDQQNDGDADDVDPNAPPQNATDAAVATLLKGLPSGSLLDAAA
jgi:hypothetical protein